MAQFTYTWDNTNVLANSLATAQRALYRVKSTGGSFISTGFSPSNDLPVNATTVDTANNLPDNKVIEFKIQCICSAGGPTDNDNGIEENINFACINPTLVKTSNSAGITLDLTGLDITKVKFTLRKSSDNTTVDSAIVNKVSNSATKSTTSLIPSTNYYWQVELYANVNSIEVISSNSLQLGSPCSPYPFTTDAPPVCNPTTAGTISSIEIP